MWDGCIFVESSISAIVLETLRILSYALADKPNFDIAARKSSLRILTDYTFKFSIARPKPKGYPDKPKTIREKIRKHRMDLRLYQKDIARFIGVSTCTIQYWETNRFKPYKSRMPVIQRFLDVKSRVGF